MTTIKIRRFNMWPHSKGNFELDIDLRFYRGRRWTPAPANDDGSDIYRHYFLPRIVRYDPPTRGIIARWGRGFIGINWSR